MSNQTRESNNLKICGVGKAISTFNRRKKRKNQNIEKSAQNSKLPEMCSKLPPLATDSTTHQQQLISKIESMPLVLPEIKRVKKR